MGVNFFLGDVKNIYLSFELVEAVSDMVKTEKKPASSIFFPFKHFSMLSGDCVHSK